MQVIAQNKKSSIWGKRDRESKSYMQGTRKTRTNKSFSAMTIEFAFSMM